MGPLEGLSANTATQSSKSQGGVVAGQPVARRVPVASDVRCIEVVGQTVWTGDRSGLITVRNVRSGEQVQTLRPQGGVNVWCLRLVRMPRGSKSGAHVWAGLSNGAIVVYDSATRTQLDHVSKHAGGVYSIVSSNGRVYSCSNDFEIHEWKADTHTFLRQFSGHRGYVRCLLATSHTLLSGSDDTDIRIWDISTGEATHVVQHHSKGVHAMVKVADDIWSAGGETIVVWNLHTLTEVAQLSQHSATVLALTRAGCRVYSAGADHQVLAWDIYSRQVVGKFSDHTGWVYALCNTAKVSRYYMWSTSINDGCMQVWHHDEYHAMDADAKDCEARTLDLATANPEGALTEHLQDSVEALQARCAIYEEEAESQQTRIRLLEEEIGEQCAAIEAQLLTRHKMNELLASFKHKVPALEQSLADREEELNRYVREMATKTQDTAALREALDQKDSKIRELERRVKVVETERDDMRRAHDTHKAAHMKYITCDVDGVLADARERETSLRHQTEQLRKQLVDALDRRAKRVAAEGEQAADKYALPPIIMSVLNALLSLTNLSSPKQVPSRRRLVATSAWRRCRAQQDEHTVHRHAGAAGLPLPAVLLAARQACSAEEATLGERPGSVGLTLPEEGCSGVASPPRAAQTTEVSAECKIVAAE